MAQRNNVTYGIVSQQRKNSLIKELFRKSIHICSSLVPFLLKLAYWPVVILLIFAVVFYSLSEFLRLRGISIPVVAKITEIAARKRDENKFVLGPVTLVIGILISFFAQIGDLCESMIKRDAGVKDSSDILPGHGGFLDRTDSYIIAIPVVYYYLQYFINSNIITDIFRGLF